MRPFYEDSSAAKMLTPELSYRYALRHMSNMQCCAYELRKYNREGSYDLIDTFVTREGAEVAKSFADIELGQPTAIVAVDSFHYLMAKYKISSEYGKTVTLSDEELNYISKDEDMGKAVIKNVIQRSK